MISPNFRHTLGDSFEKGARGLDQNSPWSYVGVGVVNRALVDVLYEPGFRPALTCIQTARALRAGIAVSDLAGFRSAAERAASPGR